MISHPGRVLVGIALTAACAAASAAPVTGTFDERLRALEAQASGSRSQVELVAELQGLRTEIRELRGMVEEQRNAVENLQRRQRDLYLDLDERLVRLEAAKTNSAPPAPGGAPTGSAPESVSGGPAPRVSSATPDRSAVSAVGERTAYEQGFELVRQRQYPAAIAAFRQFLADYPDGSYADNAQYWIAECYYVTGQTEQALIEFNKVLENYPESPKRADAKVKIGFLQDAAGEWVKARETLEQVIAEWPGSPAAQLARGRMASMRQAGH